MSKSISILAIALTASVVASAGVAMAQPADAARDAARGTGHLVAQTGRAVGHETAEVGRDAGHAVMQTGRDADAGVHHALHHRRRHHHHHPAADAG